MPRRAAYGNDERHNGLSLLHRCGLKTVRKLIQAAAALFQNSYLAFPWSRNLYQGGLKKFCTPGLNCHSCPAAVTACPLGTLQHFLAGAKAALKWGGYQLGFYVVGLITATGVLFGRIPCGWICPFGLLQEFLYKLPVAKVKLPRVLTRLALPVLLVFVFILPVLLSRATSPGSPSFCEYICPAGTLEGAGLYWIMPELKEQTGVVLYLKWGVLSLVLMAAAMVYRPYCRTICPLGYLYGLFNRISVVGLAFDPVKCTDCASCRKSCKSGLDPRKADRDPKCIRCFDCARLACKTGALSIRFIPSDGPLTGLPRNADPRA